MISLIIYYTKEYSSPSHYAKGIKNADGFFLVCVKNRCSYTVMLFTKQMKRIRKEVWLFILHILLTHKFRPRSLWYTLFITPILWQRIIPTNSPFMGQRDIFQYPYFVTTYSSCNGIDGRCVQKKVISLFWVLIDSCPPISQVN